MAGALKGICKVMRLVLDLQMAAQGRKATADDEKQREQFHDG